MVVMRRIFVSHPVRAAAPGTCSQVGEFVGGVAHESIQGGVGNVGGEVDVCEPAKRSSYPGDALACATTHAALALQSHCCQPVAKAPGPSGFKACICSPSQRFVKECGLEAWRRRWVAFL
jgi:hypothetical protein